MPNVADAAPRDTSGLVERDVEVARITAALDDAVAGTGTVVVVEGPAGIGKTSLLAAAADLAARRDMLVLRSGGDEHGEEVVFGVVQQLFAGLVRDEGARRLLSGAAALSAPALGMAEPSLPTAVDLRSAILHGLYWLTADLSEERPLMVCVDDAHWADQASCEFVLHLGRRAADLPLVLLVATRPATAAPPDAPVQALAADPRAVLLQPSALSAGGTAAVVARMHGDPAGDRFVAACHRTTGGNPFLLRELLHALRSEGVEPTDRNARRVGQLVPDSIARRVRRRVASLPPPARELAAAVALLGPGASLRVAGVMAGLEPEEAATAADHLVDAEVLSAVHPPTLVHPLVGEAIAAGVPPGRATVLHGRAARALQDEHAPPARVAAHLLGAVPGGGEWVRTVLRRAAAEAMGAGDPAQACRYLARAVEEPGSADVSLLLALGEA